MKDVYIKPQIEVIEMEIEGSVLTLSSGSSGGPSNPSVTRNSW